MSTPERTDVLVVGGGIVGLTAALALAHRGVATVLVEAHPGTSVHPRARGVNGRAMEVYRELGVEDAFRAAGAPLEPSQGMYLGHDVQSLVGALPRRPDGAPSPGMWGGPNRWSPIGGSRGTLDRVEPVVAAAARRAGARLHFGTRVTSLVPGPTFDRDGVRAELTGDHSGEVHARFAVLADGAGGGLRDRLGVVTRRGRSHGHQINILVEADLSELVRGREFSICMIEQPGLRGTFTALDNRHRWAFHIRYDPTAESVRDYPPQRCAELVARAIGPGAPPVRELGTQPWEAAEATVDRMRVGSVFLAGDTAHRMPPAGGRGAATGIVDVYELAWKLDAVLRGDAGAALLETYHDERHPAGERAVRVSGAAADRMQTMHLAPAGPASGSPAPGGGPGSGPPGSVDLHGVADRYRSAAVLREPGDPTGPTLDALDGSPGSRVPHVVCDDGRSTVDVARGTWTVLGGPAWVEAARHRGLPGHPVPAEQAAALGIDGDRALLVRPDGVVAWRGAAGQDGPGAALDAAHAALPCRIGVSVPSPAPAR